MTRDGIVCLVCRIQKRVCHFCAPTPVADCAPLDDVLSELRQLLLQGRLCARGVAKCVHGAPPGQTCRSCDDLMSFAWSQPLASAQSEFSPESGSELPTSRETLRAMRALVDAELRIHLAHVVDLLTLLETSERHRPLLDVERRLRDSLWATLARYTGDRLF